MPDKPKSVLPKSEDPLVRLIKNIGKITALIIICALVIWGVISLAYSISNKMSANRNKKLANQLSTLVSKGETNKNCVAGLQALSKIKPKQYTLDNQAKLLSYQMGCSVFVAKYTDALRYANELNSVYGAQHNSSGKLQVKQDIQQIKTDKQYAND